MVQFADLKVRMIGVRENRVEKCECRLYYYTFNKQIAQHNNYVYMRIIHIVYFSNSDMKRE